MLSLRDFKVAKLSTLQQRKVAGGGVDTDGGHYFFGYGTSTCDYKDGDRCTYYFDDPDKWRLEGDCP